MKENMNALTSHEQGAVFECNFGAVLETDSSSADMEAYEEWSTAKTACTITIVPIRFGFELSHRRSGGLQSFLTFQ